MKQEMKPGEYTQLDYKKYRCVADLEHSRDKRCILCALRELKICDFVHCQPDEREDHQPVIFVSVKKIKSKNNQ